MNTLTRLYAQHALTEAAVESIGAEVREMTKAHVSVPVTRRMARVIAELLREKAAKEFPYDRDLAVDLEQTADEFESVAMGQLEEAEA